MRRRLERALAVVIGGVAAIGIFGPSLSASGQIPPPPTRPPFSFTIPSFTTPTFTIPPPPTMPPPTMPPPTSPPPTMPPPTSSPPPTMPPPTRPSVTLPPSAEDAIEDVIATLEEFGDRFNELIDELQDLLASF
jgi:hypothetical protein